MNYRFLFFLEVGNKDSFVYYRKVICIMVFAYFIHEDTILPCATCAPFFMKGLRIWTQGWEKEPFSICVSSGYAYKTIWEWAQQRERERGLTVWRDKSDFCSLSINSSSMHTMLHYYFYSQFWDPSVGNCIAKGNLGGMSAILRIHLSTRPCQLAMPNYSNL